jgi:hypothetical protein
VYCLLPAAVLDCLHRLDGAELLHAEPIEIVACLRVTHVTVDGFESANGPAAAAAANHISTSRAAAATMPAQQQQQQQEQQPQISMAQRMRLRRGSRGADASAGSTAVNTEANTPSSLGAAAIDGSVANAV